jgi:hypothetical protein
MIDIQAIRERCERATKGPWGVIPNRKGSQNQGIESSDVQCMDNGKSVSTVFITAWKQDRRDARPDANFIAHSRADLPELLRLVEEAREIMPILLHLCGVDAESIAGRKAQAWLGNFREGE